jgi:hypothetical protein
MDVWWFLNLWKGLASHIRLVFVVGEKRKRGWLLAVEREVTAGYQ